MNEQRLVNISIIFMGLVLLAIVLQTFQAIMRPFAIALLLLFILTPLVDFAKHKNIPTWLMFLGLVTSVISLLVMASSFITINDFDLSTAIPSFQDKISQGSGPVLHLMSKYGFGLESITAEDIGKLAAKGASVGLSAVRTIFSEVLLAMILLMFVAQSKAKIFASADSENGSKAVDRLKKIFKKIQSDVLTYFATKSLMSLGTAFLSMIVLLLFGADYISVSVMLIFLLNFIPIVGSIVAVMVVLVLFIVSFGLSSAAGWLFLTLMAVQILFGNVLEPKIAGERLNISPILILISLYIWGWIWGVVGMFLSVPLTIMILIVIRQLNKSEKTSKSRSLGD